MQTLATSKDARQDSDGAAMLSKLNSPILFPGTAHMGFRDPAVFYHNDYFYLYCSLTTIEPDGLAYCRLAWSKSRDLLTWSEPKCFTSLDRTKNFGSPGCVIRDGEDFVLCFQTYPTPKVTDKYADGTARIWTMRSRDLENWGPEEMLRVKGPEVPISEMGRMIDAYLLRDRHHPGKWWCFYKQNGCSMSWSEDLKTWHYVGAIDAGENVCVIVDNDEYVLFHSPASAAASTGIGIKRSSNLKDWREGGLLLLGREEWPWAQGRITAGFVLDLREDARVGKALMFFHGSRYSEEDPRGGFANWASIGLAWSDDLQNWSWPGKA